MDSTGSINHEEAFIRRYDAGERDFSRVRFNEVMFGHQYLTNANFYQATFSSCTVRDLRVNQCEFGGAVFENCELNNIEWRGSAFPFARFPSAHIFNSEFVECHLDNASFREATIMDVSFYDNSLEETSFERARLERVHFANNRCNVINLARTLIYDTNVADLCETRARYAVEGPIFDWRAMCKSLRAPGLHRFLIHYGMPEVIALYLVDACRALDPNLLFALMQSTFISYGSPDVIFARQLRDALQSNGVHTFLFESDAIPGEMLHSVMRDRLGEYDRVILICSEAALNRSGVRNEISQTLAREAREGGTNYLIPITLDDFVFNWKDPLAVALRDRVVADFRRAYDEPIHFNTGVLSLLRALRHSSPPGSGP